MSEYVHELKTDPDTFDAVARGDKTHEIRRNDRNFLVGDTLVLKQTRYTGAEMSGPEPRPLEYTGHTETRVVSHVLEGYGLQPGWVILSFAAPACAEEDSNVIKRLSTVLAEVAAALFGEEADGNAAAMLVQLPERAQTLMLEVELYRAGLCSPSDLQRAADEVVISNATGNETLFLEAVRRLLAAVRAYRSQGWIKPSDALPVIPDGAFRTDVLTTRVVDQIHVRAVAFFGGSSASDEQRRFYIVTTGRDDFGDNYVCHNFIEPSRWQALPPDPAE